MKMIGIAGGSGFVGKHLARMLVRSGYQVIIFSRSAHKTDGNIQYASWDPANKTIDTAALAEVNAMVNLAGAGVVDKRWTTAYKQEILSSRTDAGHFLIDQLRKHSPNCTTYIASSATGIYGPDRAGSVPFTESSPPYDDFLADVCKQWEATSGTAAATYRTVILRFGIVLGKDSGAYKEMGAPMRFGLEPILGGGKQMVSWVHVNDVADMIVQALEKETMKGIYNCVAPNVISHKQLMDTIARKKGGIKIPAPVPSFVLKLMLGESSIEVLKSCTASADKILHTGFVFQFPVIDKAVDNLER